MNEIIGNIGRVLGGIGLLTLLTNYPVLVKAETALSPPKIDDTFHYEKIYKARLEDSVVSQTSLNQIVENQTIDNSNRTKSSVVYFKDPNLEAAVRSSLGYGVSNVTVYDMANLYSLNGNNKNISDLSGLEYAYNLSTIHLSNNHIKDITPLRGLTNLVNIQINDNLINDISPLGGLNKLMTLNLNNNHITDFSKIPSSVTNLTITRQYPRLNVYLNDDNTWENPFINRDGTYMNFGLMPSRIQVSADKKTLKFLDATIGTTYNFNVVGNGVTIDAILNIASPTIDLTANPEPNQNTIRLDWTSLTNNSYKVYQKKPGDTDFQTISVMDFKDTEQVKVLNIYPTYDVPDSTGYDIAGKLKKKSALLEEWIGVYGMGKIQVDSLNKEDFEANPDKWLKNSDGSYKYDVLAIGFWNILVTQQHLNDTGVQAISDFIDSGRGVLAGHHQIGEPAANNGNWKDYRVNVGLTKIREKFGVETFAEQNHYYDSKQPGVDFELGVANYENNSDSRYIYLGSKLRAVKNGLLLNYPHEIADFNKEFTVAQSHQPFLFFKGDTWFNFSEGLSYVRPFSNKTPAVEITTSGKTGEKGTNNSYLHTWNNTAIIQTGHVSVNGNLTATVDEQKILANTLFYLKQLTAQNYLDDYSGQDLAAPNKPSLKAMDSDYYGRVIVQLNPTVDKGSTYEYYVEAISKSGNKKIKSNIASATITTGIKGYSYVVDTNPNTIPDNIVEVEGTEEIVLDSSANGKYIHIRAVDNGRGSGNASETLHIKIEVKEKRIELTAVGSNKAETVRLDWTAINDTLYKVYQKKPGATEFQTISTTDLNLAKQIKVLNIYPDKGSLVTFTNWKGETYSLKKAALLKQWMEEPNDEHPKGYGQGIIDVTPVSITSFNNNPLDVLKSGGKWNYDVIMFGSWDGGEWLNLTDASSKLIHEYIEDGRGVLFGHDSIHPDTTVSNMWQFADYLGIKMVPGYVLGDNKTQQGVGGTSVKVLKRGLLTSYPWSIDRNNLTIPLSHTTSQMTNSDIWVEFDGVIAGEIGWSTIPNRPYTDSEGRTNNHYLVTNNNVAMIQTGHMPGQATPDEQKLLANTLFYLNQLSSENYLDDYSGQDIAAPNKPTLTELKSDDYGRVIMNFAPMQDNGSTYEYYVEAVSLKDDSISKSNKASATVTTGIKGVSYVVDNNPNTIPDNVIEVKELQGMIFNESDIGKYLHVKVIDNSRSGGNESETLHIRIEGLMLEANAKPDENMIRLDWTEMEESTYKLYQKKPGGDAFQTVGLTNFDTTKKINVLNVHPNIGTQISCTTWDGEKVAVPASASLKCWMEAPNSEHSKGYGKGIIEVDIVTIEEFNTNPELFLVDSYGGYKYDVIMFGTADSNGGKDLSLNALNSTKKFLEEGRGVLFGHDTVTEWNGRVNFPKLQEYINTRTYGFTGSSSQGAPNQIWTMPWSGGKTVEISKKGLLTNYPWDIGDIGSTLNIPYTHTNSQVAKGDVWLKFKNPISDTETNVPIEQEEYSDSGIGTNMAYLTTWNNAAMIQTGHAIGRYSATADEQKILANTLFYLNQLSTNNFLDDYSGQDVAAPTNPSVKSISYTMDNKINVVINPSKDNGSTYEYYVESERKDGSFNATSNKVSETIITGLAGYSYIVDNNPTSIPDDKVDTTSTTIQIPTNIQGRYFIHIKALDNVGNASETIHYELTDTTKPDLVVTASKTAWTNQDVILTAVAEDTGSGLKHLVLPDGKNTTEKTAVYTVSKNGTYRFQAEDYMGNVTTVDKAVRNIDKVAPAGGIVIADGQEKLSSEETWIEFRYADDLSGVALIEVYDLDVNGNPVGEVFRSEKPTQGNWQLEWILSHPYQKDGYQKARVGIRITDNAGNVSTYQSQEVIIESFKINRFTLTSVVNPSIYNATNPFVPLEFPNIPSQELLAGGSFSFRVNYQQSSTIPSSYRADCVANIYLIGPNGYNKKYTVTSENQSLTGQFEMTYEIPFDAPDETAVYIDIKASLKTDAGKLHSYDIFPKPDGTKLQIGVIKGDIRESIKFNETR